MIIPGAITVAIACFPGFIIFAYYTDVGCDPLANHEIANGNEVRFAPAYGGSIDYYV